MELWADSTASWLSVASVLTSITFLVFLPVHLVRLYRSQPKVNGSCHGYTKFVLAILVPILGLFNGFHTLSSLDVIPSRVIDTALSMLAATGLSWLALLAHTRSAEPSGLALLYLLASVLCNLLRSLDPERVASSNASSTLFSLLLWAEICVKIALFVAECHGKEAELIDHYADLAPEETAGVIRKVLFTWVNKILAQGAKEVLQIENLPSIGQDLSSEGLKRAILRAWDLRDKPENKSTLAKVLLKCLERPFRAAIAPRAFLVVFRYAQPILIRQSIRIVSHSYSQQEGNIKSFWMIVVASLVYIGLAVSTAMYQHRIARLRVMIRGALASLIYSRLLTASEDSRDTGSAVTLMSTDVDSLSGTAEMFHEVWGHVLEVLVGMSMLSSEIRWLWLVPMGLIFLSSRMTRYVAQNMKSRQKNWTAATQERIAATACMLGSIKSVKILGLYETVASQIRKLRVHELEQSKKVRWMTVVLNASANALGIFTPAITMILYALLVRAKTAKGMDAETAFTTIAVLSMVTHPANMVMTIVPRAVACLASFERIQSYLLDGNRVGEPPTPKRSVHMTEDLGLAAKITNATVVIKRGDIHVLQDINLDIKRRDFVFCAGSIGAGKSVLAKVILGEMPLSHGSLQLFSKRVGFCAQVAWLQGGTLREAVCGSGASSSSIDERRYELAISSVCLDSDISVLPDGDATEIGSRGLNLSGGQRQRLALARLVYARCNMIVLDDSFSALDGPTETKVVHNLLGPQGLFRREESTVVWLSNSTHHFHLADRVVILKDQGIIRQGPWAEVKSHMHFDPELASKSSTAATPTHDAVVSQGLIKLQAQKRAAGDIVVDIGRKSGDLSLYDFYARYAGRVNCCLMLACTASYSFFVTFPSYWLKWWTEADPSMAWFYINGYILLTVMAWVSTNGTVWSTYILLAVESGYSLHELLLRTVLRAPLLYFSTTDIGNILNRFSQDIQLVDNDLPAAASALGNQVFKLMVQMALLFSVQRLMLLALPMCLLVVYVVQHYYLQASRQLRLLDLESRSAVFSSFLETVEGLTTIRAFRWERAMEQRNLRVLDDSQRALYILLCLQRWLNLVLDLTIAGLAVGTISLAVYINGSVAGGAIGVALNVVLVANTTLLRLVESFTMLEMSLGAVARLKGMKETAPFEDKSCENVVPKHGSWPSNGNIELHQVASSYSNSKQVLKGISLQIPAGSKVVISGRTGSGKSTLLLSLLHLVEYSGAINVDQVDLSRVPRSIIRQRCFIAIPQDPFVMPHATLRFNLDESLAVPEQVLIDALHKVHLWHHLSESLSESQRNAVLDQTMTTLPVLSVGQTQLLSLSRAIVKKWILCSGIDGAPTATKPPLILDEATSSLDPVTEGIILDVLDSEFADQGHTLIMVTHRPNSVTNRMREGKDFFVFMSNGKIDRVEKVGTVRENLVEIEGAN